MIQSERIPIHLAAAGKGTRMKAAIEEMGYGDRPKHLLPTGEPNGVTLVERNLQLARAATDQVYVHVNAANKRLIQDAVAIEPGELVVVDPDESPLGPFTFTDIMGPDQTGASVAGDVFIDGLSWEHVIKEHLANPHPVSFLVAKQTAPPGSATFGIDHETGQIKKFERSQETQKTLRNVGLYIFTLCPPVIELLEAYTAMPGAGHEDAFATELVAAGLVRAQMHHGAFFNINGMADYIHLRDYTATVGTSLPEL